MTTLVTAFLSNVNERNDRKLDDYLEYGKKLLEINLPKIIFMEPDLIGRFDEYQNEYNKFIPYTFDEIYLSKMRDQFPIHRIRANEKKDTQNYFILMNAKPEFLKLASEINPYGHDYYTWIDFGIYHIFKNQNDKFKYSIPSLLHQYQQIRAGSCWNPNTYHAPLTLDTVQWFFAGGIIGGHKDVIKRFAVLCKETLLDIIAKHETITWEVNIWYEVYKKEPLLFSLYTCGHDAELLAGY